MAATIRSLLGRRRFFPSLLCQSLVAHQSFMISRASSTAVPMADFTLDHNLFNDNLYTKLSDLWFGNVSKEVTAGSPEQFKKWYGGGSAEEKAAFDQECQQVAGEALSSIGPEKLVLPEYISKEDDNSKAGVLSRPFLEEVKTAQSKGEQAGADTLLALVLLLDQMPRNIFRSQTELPLVYNHYDRISLALVRSALELTPSPVDLPFYAGRPVFKSWYFMPLMHSEDVSAHRIWLAKTNEIRKVAQANGDQKAVDMCDRGIEFEELHLDPIEKFGRFPHRNDCLDRESTAEELKHLESGHTFGVQQAKKSDSKDEL